MALEYSMHITIAANMNDKFRDAESRIHLPCIGDLLFHWLQLWQAKGAREMAIQGKYSRTVTTMPLIHANNEKYNDRTYHHEQ